ncbi:MAG: insulinase family protein [Lachnospiraceae bacterium]|nr:insulinase family protein [Lachnospiraceae bacterium]
MRNMKKNWTYKLMVTVLLVMVLSLVSCARFSFNVKIEGLNNSTETTVSDDTKDDIVEEETKELGDKLVELQGDVYTLSHYKLPKVGETLYGFKVNAIYDYEARNAKFVIFEHIKSGAKLVLISNDDEDKSAVFGFNTLAYDDKGIPHVFEHSCLSGSAKYPSTNLFEELYSKTYNTFMNAFTLQTATVYPFSSLSDYQLFEIYKFYMDGVMQPNVLTDAKNLDREAYRYILNDKDSDLSLSGVVYSEMAGNEGSILRVANDNSLKTMFNDSYMGVNVGGSTDYIKEITSEEIVEFHKKYYHPSNMIITLYGDIDYEKYLKYSDEEYLNKYDKVNIEKDDPNYKEQTEFKISRYDFPASENEDTDLKTIIEYNVVCDGMTPYESGLFELVLEALDNSDGPIKTRLLEKYPDVNFSINNGLFYTKPYFTVQFSNVNEEQTDDLKNIVEESFAEVIKEGINEDVLESVLNYLEYNRELSKDTHGFAENCFLEYLRMFNNNSSNIIGILEYDKAMNDIEAAYKSGLVKELMEKYISNNNHSSITITSPKKGLLEEKTKKQKDELVRFKNGLTDLEINEMIKNTKEYDEWVEKEISYSFIDMFKKATLSELDEYRAKCYAYEENVEGINFIKSEVEDIKYNHFSLLFDLTGFTMEEAMKINFLSSLILELPTKNYPNQKLKLTFNRYTLGFSQGLDVNRYYNGGFKPYYMFSVTTLDKNIDKSFELLEELIENTKFDDINIVKSTASKDLNSYKSYFKNSPTSIANLLIDPKMDNSGIYEYNLDGINYINFLNKVNAMSDSEIEDFLKELEGLYKELVNRRNMVSEIIGNFKTIKNIKDKVLNLSYRLNDVRITNRVDVATESDIKNKIAVVADGTVLYNYIVTPMLKDGIKYTSKYEVLGNIIDTKILYPEFRVKRSAYGSYSSFSRIHSYVYTYRDPYLKESLETFNNLPQLIKKLKITDDELDSFKLSAYSKFSYPLTKIGAAYEAVHETFSKVDEKRPDRYVRYMKEIKEMTTEDIDELCKIFDKMVSDGIYITIGSKEQIEANKDLFDEIIYDYIK